MRRRVRPWRQWTVRSRMVVWVATLTTVALIVADGAGMVLLESYLVKRVDDQLEAQARMRPFPNPSRVAEPARAPNFGPVTRVYLYSSDGVLQESFGSEELPVGDVPARAADREPYTVDGSWRVFAVATADGTGYRVVAVSLREIEATVDRLLLINALVSLGILLLLGIAAASVVRFGLRPLTRMERTAVQIAGGDLSRRVVDADPHTEAGRLGVALNTMLARIESAAAAQSASERRLRQFLADAAHELRTPLTSIQGFAELYRRGGAPPGPQLDEAMGRIEAEVSRMRLLVGDLLMLARLDEERPLDRRPVDLLAVAADAIRDAHVRVPSRFVALSGMDDDFDTFEPVTVLGDEARIRQVVTNLVANALQHTGEEAKVVVRVGRPHGRPDRPPVSTVGAPPPVDLPMAILEVADTGPGMAADDAARVFERLYRADPSRSRRHGGAGLGLSIVAAIVQAHGGRVELWTAPDEGARFRVWLPLAPETLDDDAFEETLS